MSTQQIIQGRCRIPALLIAALFLIALSGCKGMSDAPFGSAVTVEAFGTPLLSNMSVTASATKTQQYRVIVVDVDGLPLNDIDVNFMGQFTNGQLINFGGSVGSVAGGAVTLYSTKKTDSFGYLLFDITAPYYATGVQLSYPRDQVGTPSATGGVLRDSTYFYQITSVDLSGETTPGGAISVPVTGATNTFTGNSTGSIQLSWTSVAGATKYNVYGSNSFFPAIGYLFTVECPPAGCTGTVTTTDNGNAWPPAGAPPGVNTTGLGPNAVKGTMQATSGSALATHTIDF